MNPDITRREYQVASLLSLGNSTRFAATQLGISLQNLHNCRARLVAKGFNFNLYGTRAAARAFLENHPWRKRLEQKISLTTAQLSLLQDYAIDGDYTRVAMARGIKRSSAYQTIGQATQQVGIRYRSLGAIRNWLKTHDHGVTPAPRSTLRQTPLPAIHMRIENPFQKPYGMLRFYTYEIYTPEEGRKFVSYTKDPQGRARNFEFSRDFAPNAVMRVLYEFPTLAEAKQRAQELKSL